MMKEYYSEMIQCPFYRFTQNPRAQKGTGFWGCIHPSPNIGRESSSRITQDKQCVHGLFKTVSSEYSCRIITSHLNKEIQHFEKEVQSTLQEFS